MRDWIEMNRSTLVLGRGELASIRLRGRPCRVSCVTGRLWATATGRPEDFVLVPGEEASFTGRGRIVVEALRTAAVRLEVHAAARPKSNSDAARGVDAQRIPGDDMNAHEQHQEYSALCS